MAAGPIRVAIVNDYEIVVAGVAAMLEPYRDRVSVVELDAGLPVVSDVDVVLYDTFGQVQGDAMDLEDAGARHRREGRDLQLEPPTRPGASGRSSTARRATCPRG